MMPKKNSGQIKDQEKDEALRNQGMSKEKATRIVSAGQEASKKGGNHLKYEDWTKDDVLKKKSGKWGGDGCSKMNKEELIDVLRDH